MEDNGFDAYKRLIDFRLGKLEQKSESLGSEIAELRASKLGIEAHDRLEERMRAVEKSVENLTVRASMWGGLAGLIPIVLYLAFRAMGGK